MNLRHRLGLILVIGLVLCLALLGREFVRPEDTEQAPANIERVATVADTSASEASPAATQAAPAVTPAPNVPYASGTFRGRVIDAATREPVHEFELEFHPMHQPKPEDVAPAARTFRTKDGRFEWKGIPAQLWMITAKARGYQRFDLEQVRIPTGAATEVLMPLLRGHTLRGRVYDQTSGAGIASASIVFREAHVRRHDGNFRMRVRTTTGKDGSFVIDGVPAGSLIFSVSAPKYASREIDAVIGEHTGPLQIALSTGGTVTGYLAAADGTPLVGTVALVHLDEGRGSGFRTGDAGEFKFERLPAGRYQIRGRSGSRTGEQELILGQDERKDGFVLTLGGGRSIRGVVTGVRPADVGRVRVTVRDGSFNTIGESGVDARGGYEIQGVEPGQMTVMAALGQSRRISKTIQMPPDADVTANLEFPRGSRLTGNVTRGGKPLANAWVGPRGLEEDTLDIEGTRTSARGEYAIEDVPDGEYFMQLDGYASRNFRVSGDTVVDIEVPTTRLSGRIVEEGGKTPVVGVDLYIWSMQPESRGVYRHERSDHLGEFEVAGMERGDYMLSAYKPGYEMYRERISYDAATGAMTIGLREGKGVAIRLQEAGSARPIRNAQVSESIGGRPGTGLRLRLDENGVGYLPSGLAGSTLTFHARAYAPAVVSDWNGQELELQLRAQSAQ
jgi:hypothetical protein